MKLINIIVILSTSLLSVIDQGYCGFSCYTTDPATDTETCGADAELCYEVATTDDNNAENCIYLRGCIQEQIQFPNQDAINYLVKEQNRNGLFQVCAGDKCNNKRHSCNPQNYKKMWEDESKKVENLRNNITIEQQDKDDRLKEINSLKEKLAAAAADEGDANTKAAGTSYFGLAIAFICICVFLLGVIIGGLLFHKKKMNKHSPIQGNDTTEVKYTAAQKGEVQGNVQANTSTEYSAMQEKGKRTSPRTKQNKNETDKESDQNFAGKSVKNDDFRAKKTPENPQKYDVDKK